MKILNEKSKANFEIAKRLLDKENNICAARLYYSAYQETCILLNSYSKEAQLKKHTGEENVTLLQKVAYTLSDKFMGSHDKRIKALKILIGVNLGYLLSNNYEHNVISLQKMRQVADYKNRHITKDEITNAFETYKELKTIFQNITKNLQP